MSNRIVYMPDQTIALRWVSTEDAMKEEIRLRADGIPYKIVPDHPMVGDIYEASWGYDQTNVDYYQVIRVSAKSVWTREIGKRQAEHRPEGYSSMSVQVVPCKDKFKSEKVFCSRINARRRSVKIDGHYADYCDEKPIYMSWYA